MLLPRVWRMKIMARIVAERLLEYLERSGSVIIKGPPAMGGATLRRGSDGGASYRSTAPRGAKIDHGSWELTRSRRKKGPAGTLPAGPV